MLLTFLGSEKKMKKLQFRQSTKYPYVLDNDIVEIGFDNVDFQNEKIILIHNREVVGSITYIGITQKSLKELFITFFQR